MMLSFVKLVSLVILTGVVFPPLPSAQAQAESQPEAEVNLPGARYWFGVGPMVAFDSGYSLSNASVYEQTYKGANLAGAVDILMGDERKWILQFKAALPWTKEVAQGNGAGRISRLQFLPGLGYRFAGDLEILLHTGLTYIYGQNDQFDAKLGFTPGISLNLPLSEAKTGKLYQALELGFYRVAQTSGTIGDLGVIEGVCSAFSSNDPSCARGIAPAQYQILLLYKIGGQN